MVRFSVPFRTCPITKLLVPSLFSEDGKFLHRGVYVIGKVTELPAYEMHLPKKGQFIPESWCAGYVRVKWLNMGLMEDLPDYRGGYVKTFSEIKRIAFKNGVFAQANMAIPKVRSLTENEMKYMKEIIRATCRADPYYVDKTGEMK